MQRKAQVTVFVIIGILMLVGLATYFIFNDIIRSPEADIPKVNRYPVEQQAIRNYVEGCIEEEATPLLYQVAYQGGTLEQNPLDGRLYAQELYTYACDYETDHWCVNNLFTRFSMEQQLNVALQQLILDCVNLEPYREQAYEVSYGALNVDTQINVDDVKIDVTYPLTLTKDQHKVDLEIFTRTITIPLGRTHDLVVQIVNGEIEELWFDKDMWMKNHAEEIQIEMHKPYPDIVYKLTLDWNPPQDPLLYLFSIEGFSTVDRIGEPTERRDIYGWCRFTDNNCYANTQEPLCTEQNGAFSTTKPAQCDGITVFSDELCDGLPCKGCAGGKQHGESWCAYDALIGPGLDYVGSRHYKRSCINGNVYFEECRDYREELCTTFVDRGLDRAVCRPNRWQQCHLAASEGECAAAGDCYWSDWITKGEPMTGAKSHGADFAPDPFQQPARTYANRKCIPHVAPAFRFWIQEGNEVCMNAADLNDCDWHTCNEQSDWVDSTASYCFMQGDCGMYRNIYDQVTTGGFLNSNSYAGYGVRPYIFFWNNIPFNDPSSIYALTLDPTIHTPLTLDGTEFESFQSQFDHATGQEQEYLNFAKKKYTASEIEKHIIREHLIPLNFPITIHYWSRHVGLCFPWNAPLGARADRQDANGGNVDVGTVTIKEVNCAFCSENPNKPCTLYRCRSLGERCQFLEVGGIGQCQEVEEDPDGPIISFGEVRGNYTTIEDFFGDAEGIKIIPEVQPLDTFTFTVELSEPAKCKMTPLFNIDYFELASMARPIGNGDFQRTYTIDVKANNNIFVLRDILANSDVNSLLQLGTFSLFDNIVLDVVQGILEAYAQVGSSLINGAIASIQRDYQLIIRPTIADFYTDFEAVSDLLVQYESNNYVLFFKCIDRSGNLNENEFFVKYTVAEDTFAPELINVVPDFKTVIRDPEFTFDISLNEPATCKFSVNTDLPYELMPNRMACDDPTLDFSALFTFLSAPDRVYHCDAETFYVGNSPSPDMDIYVKCKDQPASERQLGINFRKTDNFALVSALNPFEVELVQPIIINTNELNLDVLDMPVVNVSAENVVLTFKTGVLSQCRYGTDADLYYEDLSEENQLTCASTAEQLQCSATLPVPESMHYFITCTSSNIPEGNINEESFKITYRQN